MVGWLDGWLVGWFLGCFFFDRPAKDAAELTADDMRRRQ
jgi:hypothetical protein